MYLKRLDLHGFKSFADRVSMEYVPGINAVVGPNGSGKSNLADALRWVLGEQSPRMLRGTRMEDVIFGGTERRKPVGLAEVEITLDNSDGSLGLDFAEVTVTRRVDRAGEGEYLLNGVPCRLRDIQDLFTDTGVGREAYSVVGQGRIDEILSHRPEDRRGLFEEAAGIVRYKLRKREALRRLEETQANVVRLRDLLGELEDQRRILGEQAGRAQTFQSYRGEWQGLELRLLVQEIERLSAELRTRREEYDRLREAEAGAVARVATLEAAQEGDRGKLADLEEDLAARQARLVELTAAQSRTQGEVGVAEEKLAAAGRERARLEVEAGALRERRARLVREEEEAAARRREREAEAGGVSGDLARDEAEAQALLAELTRRNQALQREQGRVVELARRVSDRKNWLGSGTRGSGEAQANLERLGRERQEVVTRREEEAARLAAARQALEELEGRRDAAAEEIGRLEVERERYRTRLADLARREKELRERRTGLASRLKLLEEMHREFEGYQRGVKSLLTAAGQGPRGLLGVVADLLSLDPRHELAIETVLGGALQNVVTEKAADAQAAIEWLKRHEAGRVTFLPLDTVRSNLPRQGEWAGLDTPGVIGPALDLVRFEERFRPAMAFLLGRVVVCRDLRSALALGRKNEFRPRIVTLEGELVTPGGALTGGSNGSRGVGLLSRQRERGELASGCREADLALEAHARESEELHSGLQRLEEALARAQRELHQTELAYVQREKDQARNVEEYARLDERVTDLGLEEARLSAQLAGSSRLAEQWGRELEELEGEYARMEERQAAEAEAIRQLGEEREAVLGRATGGKVRLATVEQEVAAIASGQAQRREALAELDDLQRLKTAEKERLFASEEALGAQLGTLRGRVAEASEAIARLEREMSAQAADRQELVTEVSRRDRELRSLRRTLGELQEQLRAAEVEQARRTMEVEAASARLVEQHHLDLAQARERLPGLPEHPAPRERIAELQRLMEALGEVNLAAIEENRRVTERYEFLRQQHRDLDEARESLQRAIAELDQRIRARFGAAFTSIRSEFLRLFTRFFGGGRADLLLVDEADLLATGIEIIAQPPGKNLQHLSLLSGGERALTAIALLFAVLRVKPAPFYVLDEIEAALDEENAERFASVLREFGQTTQFIVVTHQKRTMAVADILYGVTMEEEGVSRLISVRLEEQASGRAS